MLLYGLHSFIINYTKNNENSCHLIKKPKWSQKAKHFFQGQTRNKKAKIELFGRKKAKLPTLHKIQLYSVAFFKLFSRRKFG
jgi:hypothetical protein